MPRGSDSDGGWFKWVVGSIISLLAAGSGIVALLTYLGARSTPTPPTARPPTAQPTAVVCSVSGHVYDKDTNRPLPNIEVRYHRFTTQGETAYQQRIRSYLATTDINGSFSAQCSTVEKGNFPLRLELSSAAWHVTTHVTDVYVARGQKTTNVNLYVPDKLLRNLPTMASP
ncbi:MAG: hypothetical protein KF716_31740 [Anaerolineae bacterium]|nr:hypothetical protein [Anaerolineae bacterium]